MGMIGAWWTSTEVDAETATLRWLYQAPSTVFRVNDNKKNGFSVRCIVNMRPHTSFDEDFIGKSLLI
jgi:hypothetical protein